MSGARTPAAAVVALNAAVAFWAIGAENELPDAFARARGLLESGAVWPAFERARDFAADG